MVAMPAVLLLRKAKSPPLLKVARPAVLLPVKFVIKLLLMVACQAVPLSRQEVVYGSAAGRAAIVEYRDPKVIVVDGGVPGRAAAVEEEGAADVEGRHIAATVRDARASESETLTCKVCEPIGRRPAEKVRPPAVVSEAVNAILVVLLHVWPARLPHLGG